MARAELAKDQAVVHAKNVEAENGDLKAKLDSTEKRFKVASDEVAALKNKLIDSNRRLQRLAGGEHKEGFGGKRRKLQIVAPKYEDQRNLNAELKKNRGDVLTAHGTVTKAPNERSLLTAAKKEVDRLSAQVRDYKAEIDRLKRAPPTPAPKSVIGASGGKTTVLLGFFEYNNCASVDKIGKDINLSPGLVEYHASRLTEEQLLVLGSDYPSHWYCITNKGRAYVVDKDLIGH